MKSVGPILTLVAASILVSVTAIVKTKYNGDMRFFFADLGPTYPCHPLYERDFTWIGADEENPKVSSVRFVLEGLAEAGFNGIRLPMWPDSPREFFHNPNNGLIEINHQYCSNLTVNIVNVIRNATDDDVYKDFYIYMSPGYDNMLYQEDLTPEEYVMWVRRNFNATDPKPQFVSPFSANVSPLENYVIEKKSKMQDKITLYEIDVFTRLRNLISEKIEVPILIGPDRSTVQHSVNVLDSFNGELASVRPEYRLTIDIIGTQARLGDQTAVDEWYSELRGNTTAYLVWCTMCSQEWYREKEMSFGYGLSASRVPNGYWTNYKKYWGEPQPPAS